MVESSPSPLDTVFQALTDPTRRAMLRSLAMGERNIGELAAPFDMSLAAASKHVKVLERAGLVRRVVQGRVHVCQLDPAPLATADAWLRFYEQFWNQRLDVLDALLKAEDRSARKPPRKGKPR
ncbi:MAG TPA: metalloregulator ArsR/SmtB family transcription factor [Dyella sp.]|uniref:ArsR/SmtB family transcription factor n=1 Tax=Dyella sp. TaxID=1869338 RepID=UPI002D792ED3|nr:metalloregulator ArsR/SmtB family transcription factor [Dyella sp.]HET6553058.1 metalloregulator ArsR/SmtB family transcription factor [Dyella sp.]